MPDSTDRSDHADLTKSSSFQSVFEYAAAGMFVLNSEGHFGWVNDALCQLLGYAKHELLATIPSTITHPADCESDLARLGQLKAGSIRSYWAERRWLHKSGQVVSAVESICAVRSPGTSTIQILGVVQGAAEAKLTGGGSSPPEQLATTRQMVHSIAHEGRNAVPANWKLCRNARHGIRIFSRGARSCRGGARGRSPPAPPVRRPPCLRDSLTTRSAKVRYRDSLAQYLGQISGQQSATRNGAHRTHFDG